MLCNKQTPKSNCAGKTLQESGQCIILGQAFLTKTVCHTPKSSLWTLSMGPPRVGVKFKNLKNAHSTMSNTLVSPYGKSVVINSTIWQLLHHPNWFFHKLHTATIFDLLKYQGWKPRWATTSYLWVNPSEDREVSSHGAFIWLKQLYPAFLSSTVPSSIY